MTDQKRDIMKGYAEAVDDMLTASDVISADDCHI